MLWLPRLFLKRTTQLCVGINKDYFIVNISTGAMTEMFGVKQGKHIAAKLPKNEILVSRDSMTDHCIVVAFNVKSTIKA